MYAIEHCFLAPALFVQVFTCRGAWSDMNLNHRGCKIGINQVPTPVISACFTPFSFLRQVAQHSEILQFVLVSPNNLFVGRISKRWNGFDHSKKLVLGRLWNLCGWEFNNRLDKSGRINTPLYVTPDKEVDQKISSRVLFEADFL